VRPPGAESPTWKTIQVVEIPLAATTPGKWRRKSYPRTTWRTELRQFALNAHLEWVNMNPYNLFVWDQSSRNFFSINVDGVVVDQILFRFADMSISWGDIRDQSWKLSEMASNSGRFLSPFQILGGRPSKTYTHFITPTSWHVAWKKFCEDTPTSPEVIGAHILNLSQILNFHDYNFWGTPGPPSNSGVR